MPDVQEVFRMTTQKVRPDPGALERQLQGQRSRTVKRKAGAFALVAALGAVAIVAAIVSRPDGPETPIGNRPPPETPRVDYTIDLETGTIAPLPQGIARAADEIGGFAVSPEGGVIAFNGAAEDGTTQVFMANLDGTGVRQLTNRPGGARFPAWSADGSRLAYASPADGTQNVFTLDLASSRSTKVTSESAGFLGSFGFSPDGASLIYTWDPQDGDGGRIMIVPLAGGKSTVLLDPKDGDAGDGVLSPNGRYLSFGGSDIVGGEANRQLADADGRNVRLLVEGNFPSAAWSPDSSSLAYWSYPEHEVFVIDIASGESTEVAEGAWPVWLDDHTLIVEPESGL